VRALLALLLFAGPLLGQAANGWAPIENGWGEVQIPSSTSAPSGLTSGRVTLSTGATTVGDDAGCTWTGTGASFVQTFGGGISVGNGTYTAPSITFSSDSSLGFYKAGASDVSFVYGGLPYLNFNYLGLGVRDGGKVGFTSGGPASAFDLALSRASAGTLLVEDGAGNARDVQARTGTFGTSVVTPLIDAPAGGDLTFNEHVGNKALRFSSSALFPAVDATQNIGTADNRWYNGYFAWDVSARTGTMVVGLYSPLLSTAPDATGTNTAGANLTIQPQAGTGTGTAGKTVFKAPTAQASGSTTQTQATVLTLQDSGTGGTSAPQALFPSGTAAFPAIDLNGDGLYSYAAGDLRMAVQGAEHYRFLAGGTNISSADYFGWGGTGIYGTDAFLTRADAATIRLGRGPSATPVAQTLTAPESRDGADTNVAGANLTIRPGAGTGSATGSSIVFQTPTATTSGTTGQTQTTRLTLSEPAVIAAVPVRLKGYTVATLPAGTVGDTAYVTDATAPTYLGALTGGGAVVTPVFYNGAAWVSH